jgi:hypothetical protein
LKPEDRITIEQILEHEFFMTLAEEVPQEKDEQNNLSKE